MPTAASHTFHDPDAYRLALQAASGDMTVTGSGVFRADLFRMELSNLLLQRGHGSVPRVSRILLLNRIHFAFASRMEATQLWAGHELQRHEVVIPPIGDDMIVSSHGAGGWASVSLFPDDLSRLSTGLIGHDLTLPRSPQRFAVVHPWTIALLRRLSERVEDLARRAPDLSVAPALVRRCNDTLMRALFTCLDRSEPQEDRAAARRHTVIMKRLHAELAKHPDEPLELGELCLAVGANLRTLHICCQEYLGMSPGRYLRLRRMNQARRVLLDSGPGETTVTDVALRHGFWELGRFAKNYRRLFGEAPSATLNGAAARG